MLRQLTHMEPCCSLCQAPKAPRTCELCHVPVCKECVEKLGPRAFEYMFRVPAELSHTHYCLRCYDQQVAPALAAYDTLAEKAKDTYFLTSAYRGYLNVLERHTTRIELEGCLDRRDMILRLAYAAAELGYNSIIDAKVESYTPPHTGYKSARWRGSAMPALLDGKTLERTSLRQV